MKEWSFEVSKKILEHKIIVDTNVFFGGEHSIKKILKNKYKCDNYFTNIKNQIKTLNRSFKIDFYITQTIKKEFIRNVNIWDLELIKSGIKTYAKYIFKDMENIFKIFDDSKLSYDKLIIEFMKNNFSKSNVKAYDISDWIIMAIAIKENFNYIIYQR